MACIIDSWVPTASMTECAPSPLVSSLISATPSSPREVMMSVAPNCRARAWRDGIMVFSEHPTPCFASVPPLTGVVGKPRDRVALAIKAARDADQMSDQKVWAYDLFSASFFLPSAEARFLMLMTALETMIEQGPRPDDVQAWVGELISQTEQAALDSGQKASQVFSSAQLKSWLPSRACRHLFVLLRGQISVDVQPAQEPAGPLGVGGPGAGGHPAGGQARRRTSRPLRTLRTSAATGRRPAGLPRTGSPTVRVVVRVGGGESADGELGVAQRLGRLRRLALRSGLVILCHKGIRLRDDGSWRRTGRTPVGCMRAGGEPDGPG